MPKNFLKRYMPKEHDIRNHKHMRFFGKLLHDPNIWHLNRRSVSGAFSVGLFMAMVPVPFQMALAAAAAIPLRVNLPISVGLVWITNPLTIPAIFYFAYKVGATIMSTSVTLPEDVDFSWEWLTSGLSEIWAPFLLGCFVLGVTLAILGNLFIRFIWRLHLLKYLERRKLRKKAKAKAKANKKPKS